MAKIEVRISQYSPSDFSPGFSKRQENQRYNFLRTIAEELSRSYPGTLRITDSMFSIYPEADNSPDGHRHTLTHILPFLYWAFHPWKPRKCVLIHLETENTSGQMITRAKVASGPPTPVFIDKVLSSYFSEVIQEWRCYTTPSLDRLL